MPGRNAFSDDKKGSYNPLSLGEWSDDSSDEGERDFVRDQIRSQRQQLKQHQHLSLTVLQGSCMTPVRPDVMQALA